LDLARKLIYPPSSPIERTRLGFALATEIKNENETREFQMGKIAHRSLHRGENTLLVNLNHIRLQEMPQRWIQNAPNIAGRKMFRSGGDESSSS
jgi:hypothetical protein